MDVLPYRLPGIVRPTSYVVDLTARVGVPSFQGLVRIDVDVREPTRDVELHARDMTFQEVHAEVGGRKVAGRAEPDPSREKLTLRFPEALPKGKATLGIAFTGQVSHNMEGLYLSKDGAEECLATQCEETDARGIFPCFDEPAYKATFQWVVTTDAKNTVLANGPLQKVEDASGGMRRWTFAPTRPMSSYLVAIAVGPFASSAELRSRDVPLRVWAMKGKEGLGAWGNEFTARAIPWFEDYFALPYPFVKYDQIALPSFSAGAMENAGLVTFRQMYLLLDPATASFKAKKAAARVIAHEMAHMWFGDLVTMAWWDDIWLNESFAEWIAHKTVAALEPDYRIWEDFQQGKAAALSPDALESTHSIYSPVETPAQATELFDLITYQKGSSVMRMLETFLGEEAFRAGLRTYMREFAESNAKGADLWRHLAAASRQPVGEIMESWILQRGHPVVRAELAGSALRVSQRRFFSSPRAKPSPESWRVPLIVRWRDDAGVHEARHLLRGERDEVPLKAQGKLRWLTANADAVGFYRQDLSDALQASLVAHVGELSASEQMGLLDDAWGLARNATRPLTRYLDALDAVMRAATNPTVLDRVVDDAINLEGLLEDTGDAQALARFRAWVGAAFRPRWERLGPEPRPGEPRDDALARASALRAMASLARDSSAIEAATRLADREAQDASSVDANLAGTAVLVAAQFGDLARLEKHVRLYEERRAKQAPPADTQRYLTSFAFFRGDPALLQVLRLVDEKRMPLEAVGPLLRLMFSERSARLAAWNYLKAHWAPLRESLGDMWTGNLVEASGQIPPRFKDDFVRFYATHLGAVAQQAYGRALESLELRGEFQARTKDDLVAWFRAK